MFHVLLLVGLILILGGIIGRLTHHLKITAVVGYIVVGILLGPVLGATSLLGMSESAFSELWIVITNLTLALIAFVIGSQLTVSLIRGLGKPVIGMLFAESIGATVAVMIGTYLYTGNAATALILGSLAAATDPAAAVAVLHEYRARGPLSNALLMLVGWDDAVASTIVVISMTAVKSIMGVTVSAAHAILVPMFEILGALVLGSLIGIMLTLSMKRIVERESILVVSLAAILTAAGLSELFGFSLILTCMAVGIASINFSPQKGNTSRVLIEELMPPIYIVFFAMAGMHLRPDLLFGAGGMVLVYIICRMIGKWSGISLSARASGAPPVFQKYLGFGMFPQGGLAVGLMALFGTEIQTLPGGADLALLGLTVIMATTIVFEVIGPVGVRYAITKAGEAHE